MSSQQRPLVVYSADSIQLTQPERERLSTLKSASAARQQPVTSQQSASTTKQDILKEYYQEKTRQTERIQNQNGSSFIQQRAHGSSGKHGLLFSAKTTRL